MKTNAFVFGFLLSFLTVFSQQNTATDSIKPRVASINYKTAGDSLSFTADTPPLEQIAGAPKAFYTYYWEFGDGNYSKEKNPKHIYKDKGDYEVKLWVTNNYDTGKPPVTRPKKINVSKADDDFKAQASMTEDFTLQRNREPVPDQDMVLIMSYKNENDYLSDGRLYLFYNEQKYAADNFELIDTRTYHGEKDFINNDVVYNHPKDDFEGTLLASTENTSVTYFQKQQDSTKKTDLPKTLKESNDYYKNSKVLEFKNMEPKEERNVFFTLKTTPEMLKDTSAIISVRGVYVPDSNYSNHTVKEMEMEIVTSHDPNKMSSNGTFLNYRLVRFKTLKYKIKFQNNGEGPARKIRLETDIPEMLDKQTIEVIDMYPKVKICPKQEVQYSCLDTTFTDKQAIFTFKNIYLPGSEQKNVKEYDSTKGFVKYKIKFSKDFHKKKTKSRTAIIFDKNEPIITNYSTTRFLPGISIGAKAGYNYFPDLKDSKSYFIGATVSPYKSYRWYWQVELLNSFHNYDSETTVTEEIIGGAQGFEQLQRTTASSSFQNIDWEIPILVRYNINNYIGLGAGLNTMISLSEKQDESLFIERFEGINPQAPIVETLNTSSEFSDSFTNLRTGFLVEITGGFARIGPSFGARYVLNFKDNFNYLQLYGIWKF
ncbi:PKD domain-containing protein [Winogradskyella wandonensis]|uniref:PKD domain-containing protein n=1 Tax=Winogradskyella wandonensis TaxID=1442586 RepID=A0A4R1KJW0_9FLAO|nr:PKD domain-containing protein [Winogradskyella wandonensis]TCK65055.1 PKD domain-containing protein [Winogradskyella wandonensis]